MNSILANPVFGPGSQQVSAVTDEPRDVLSSEQWKALLQHVCNDTGYRIIYTVVQKKPIGHCEPKRATELLTVALPKWRPLFQILSLQTSGVNM